MAVTTDKRDSHGRPAGAAGLQALATTNQLAVVVARRIREVDRTTVSSTGLKLEEFLEELQVDR